MVPIAVGHLQWEEGTVEAVEVGHLQWAEGTVEAVESAAVVTSELLTLPQAH